MRSVAANIWPMSLNTARKGTRSSRTPMKKITNRAKRIHFISFQDVRLIQIREERKKAQKIAMPHIEAVTFLWSFRRPGMSRRFFFREYLMMTGTIRNEKTKDVIAAAN